MVRLKDIAARANVSVMTVSKGLRDAPDISPATKARVRLLAEQMGYVPDVMAQSLRNRNTRLFGLVVPTANNPVFARVITALEQRCHEMGYELLLAHTLNLPEREEATLRRLLARRIEGLFISPVHRLQTASPAYEELYRRGTPTVILGQRSAFCGRFTGVEAEDAMASCAATKHLIELGHKRIIFLGGPPTSPVSAEQFDGYKKALRDSHLEADERLVFQAGSTIEDGENAALQILNERPGATAIQSYNDLVAIGVAGVLIKQGIRIPQDVSLVGYGNSLISEHFKVPLTTVAQPKFRLGIAAMDLMVRILQGQRPETKRLPAELVVRSSTASPGRSII